MIADFLWMSDGDFLHYWLAISLTLIILDVFINTDLLSWVAMALFATWATACIDPPAAWSVLVFMGFFMLAALFYMTVLKKIAIGLTQLADNKADTPPEPEQVLPGKTGEVKLGEEGCLCVVINGQTYLIEDTCRPNLTPGDTVAITAYNKGIVKVCKVK
ncbi:MAG: hypothetical protein E7033_04970 [Akkermansiaceae bacterium]|nr:hypothetical protein [Akkermansiaceae bacterium]